MSLFIDLESRCRKTQNLLNTAASNLFTYKQTVRLSSIPINFRLKLLMRFAAAVAVTVMLMTHSQISASESVPTSVLSVMQIRIRNRHENSAPKTGAD